jgi:hypothetical protein
VSSYFVFLRWICWMNLVIAAMLVVMVVVPEVDEPRLPDGLFSNQKNPLWVNFAGP